METKVIVLGKKKSFCSFSVLSQRSAFLHVGFLWLMEVFSSYTTLCVEVIEHDNRAQVSCLLMLRPCFCVGCLLLLSVLCGRDKNTWKQSPFLGAQPQAAWQLVAPASCGLRRLPTPPWGGAWRWLTTTIFFLKRPLTACGHAHPSGASPQGMSRLRAPWNHKEKPKAPLSSWRWKCEELRAFLSYCPF